jgi:hypothetical protein
MNDLLCTKPLAMQHKVRHIRLGGFMLADVRMMEDHSLTHLTWPVAMIACRACTGG